MAEQNPPQGRQQNGSYPSPHSYPSPSLQPTYTYPPPQGQPNAEPYRASPTAQNMSLPSLNLPPIRSIDGQAQMAPPPPPQQQQQQQQQQQPPAPQMGSPLPPPVAPMSAYYPHPQQSLPPPGQPMNITSSPHNMTMRYQLPPQGQDARIMSGGRHKKEIKRRTKTGCLTCRKRRIKCDEGHPTCRNCAKSKRECLGYDPIFKQQPGPPQIQPAPSAAPIIPPSAAAVPPPPTAYSHIPQGYVPASSAPYAPPLGSSIPPSGPPVEPSYEFNAAIDPALAAADPAMAMPPAPYDALRHGHAPYPTHSNARRELKIEELFVLQGVHPPPPPAQVNALSPSALEEVRNIFASDYAPGLDRVLETNWYTTRGIAHLEADTLLAQQFAHLLEQFRTLRHDQFEESRRLPSTEASIIWQMFCLPRKLASAASNGTNGVAIKTEDAEPEDFSVKEVNARLEILEGLLTGRILPTNPVMQLAYAANDLSNTAKYYETEFWRHLGNFVSLREDDPNQARDIEIALGHMRSILSQLENRDVIYSIAIAKYYGFRMPDFPEGLVQTYSNDDSDPRTKVFVAKKFIEDEAQAGTSQVISRVAGMAIRSWIAHRT